MRHRTDFLSLIFGLIFLLAVVWWTLGRRIHIGLPVVGWSVAGALILLGVVGLLGALRGSRRAGEVGGAGDQYGANRQLDDRHYD